MCLICTLALTIVHPGLFFSQSALLKQGKPFSKKNEGLKDDSKVKVPRSNPSDTNVEKVVEEGGVKEDALR